MRTRIAYLTGLTRQTAGQAPLRPSRRLFASDAYAPVRPPNRRSPAEGADDVTGVVAPSYRVDQPRLPAAVTSLRGENAADIAADGVVAAEAATAASGDRPAPAAVLPPAAAQARERAADPKLPAGRNEGEPAAILPRGLITPAGAPDAMAPTGTDLGAAEPGPTAPPTVSPPRSPQSPSAPAPAARTPVAPDGSGHAADAPIVTPATHHGANAQMPSQSAEPGGRVDTYRSKAADPAAVPPDWGMPVELPPGIDPAAGGAPNPAGSQVVMPGVAHARDSVADPPPRTAAIQDLMPTPAPASTAIAQSGNGRVGERGAGVSSRASVSIGTLEITVLPPGRPDPAPGDVAPIRARAGSVLAVGAGSDRLRDGVRRWYGTAQG